MPDYLSIALEPAGSQYAILPADTTDEIDLMASELACTRSEFASLVLVGWARRRQERRVQDEARS